MTAAKRTGREAGKRILITGGTGFIGSHLTEHLLGRGHAVACLVRDPKALKWLSGLDVAIIPGDCSRPETLAEAVQRADLVIHAAGLTKATSNRKYYEVNHLGTRNILEACRRHNPGLQKFVLLSSLAAAGPGRDGHPAGAEEPAHPVSDYGRSKLLGEQEALRYKEQFPVVILRPPVVYGPRDRDLYELFLWASRGIAIEIAGPERFLSFCYVGDLVEAIIKAAERPVPSGSIYCVAEETSYSWSGFRQALLSGGRVKAVTVKIPYAAAYLIGIASEAAALFTGRPALTNRQKVREAAQQFWICDPAPIIREIGFQPAYPLQKGLDITWRWYRDNNWLH